MRLSTQADFYQSHLNRVSRSFAFCIERLDEVLRPQVGLAYLLCRVLDTIEDSPFAMPIEKQEQFHQFNEFILYEPQFDLVSKWIEKFPTEIPRAEQELIGDSFILFSDFHGTPEKVQAALRDPILSMSRGMEFFALRNRNETKLTSLTDVNRYCFFVAGVVGEMLTGLIDDAVFDTNLDHAQFWQDSVHFGLFLQKVNLLKDQKDDERVLRFLVPDRKELKVSAIENARCALRYVLALPEALLPYKLFCSWSLFLGLASLPFIEEAWDKSSMSKISRSQTQELLNEVENRIRDNQALKELWAILSAVSSSAGNNLAVSNASDAEHDSGPAPSLSQPMQCMEAQNNHGQPGDLLPVADLAEIMRLYQGRFTRLDLLSFGL